MKTKLVSEDEAHEARHAARLDIKDEARHAMRLNIKDKVRQRSEVRHQH